MGGGRTSYLVRRFSSRAFLAIFDLMVVDSASDRSRSCLRKSWCRVYMELGRGAGMWARYWVEFSM